MDPCEIGLIMKRYSILLCVLFAVVRASAAEAILSYTNSFSIVGYATGGGGFAFSPTQPIFVTSLGCDGDTLGTNEPFQVTVWDTGGNQLASATVNFGSPIFNTTHYESISPLGLNAGQTYYIGTVGIDSGLWLGHAIQIPPHPDPTGDITVSPDITYLGAATGQNAGVFPNTVSQGAFLIGANFQYIIPEPSTLSLIGLVSLMVRRRKSLRNSSRPVN
jgi:hypothetical protein